MGVPTVTVAIALTALGDHEEALRWLERAEEERSWLLMAMNCEPAFDPLRTEPRFTALLGRRG